MKKINKLLALIMAICVIISLAAPAFAAEGESTCFDDPSIPHTLVNVEAVEPTCDTEGQLPYVYCSVCYGRWENEACEIPVFRGYGYLAALGHEWVEYPAVESTCNSEGNIAYKQCSTCGAAQDTKGMPLSMYGWVLGPTDHNAVHVEAVEPGCHFEGNVEYWVCYDCEGVWTNKELTEVSNIKNVIIPALGGEVAHVEAVAATCYENGNIEYWHCAECEKVWQDEALTQLTNSKNVIVPAAHTNVVEHEAVAPTCNSEGQSYYIECLDCGAYENEKGMRLSKYGWILGATDHNAVHMDAVEPGCHFEGNVEYWVCYDCEGVWTNKELTEVSNIKNVVIPALGGEVAHVEAVAATCNENGNIEYWHCAECEKVWQNEALTQLTNIKNVVVPAAHTNVVEHEAIAPTCNSEGQTYYIECLDCGAYENEKGMRLSKYGWVLGPTDHNAVHMDAVEPDCHYNGNVEYWVCYDCEGVWTNEELTQVSNSKNVIIAALGGEVVHVEAKDATCYENGNIEYWYCEKCEQVWQNEALTQLTNSKNVIVGAAHTLEHFEGEEATCHGQGVIEHWYCTVCGATFTDEYAIYPIASLSTIIPPVGSDNVIHVEAKKPTATKDGNVEYWYCEDCESYYLDEECTQLANAKRVIVPATGEEAAKEDKLPQTGAVILPIAIAATLGMGLVVTGSVLRKEN